jgi:methionine-rich copper-binding protein CopC/putative copper export protein
MQKRHYLRILVSALACAGLLLMGSWMPLANGAPRALAHAFVVGSDPIDGSTINRPPAQVRIYFDAPISPLSQATVYVYLPGSPVKHLASTNHGTINAHNPQELDVALLPANKLPQGGYSVEWSALSLTDGHTTSGLIGFNLGYSNTGVDGTPLLGPSTSNHFPQLTVQGALSIAWDWLVTLALIFWVGMLVTETFILTRVLPEDFLVQARKHARSLQTLCLAGLLVGELINLVLRASAFAQTASASNLSLHVLWQFVLSTNYSYLWLARMVLLIAAAVLFRLNKDRRWRSSAHARSKNSQRFRQLRQQARPEGATESSGPVTRPQARVTGAVATSVSPTRSHTGAQPRLTTQDALAHGAAEAPVSQPSPWLTGGLLALAALILLTLVLSDELLQLTALPISTGLLSWLALVAQAIWFGAIAYLGFVLLPLQLVANSDQHADLLIRLLKGLKPFLLAAIGVLLVCELFLNESTIQTPFEFFDHPYGRALLVRDLLLMLMIVITGIVLFGLLPRLQRQAVLLPVVTAEMPARRTRTFKLEKTERTIKRALHGLAALGAATLICVALMNFFAPPVIFPDLDYAALVNQANASTNPTTQTQNVGGLTIDLSVSPARVNTTNTVSLTIKDAQGKAISNATVKLAVNMQIMDMGTATTTINGGNPGYTATFQPGQAFTMAGLWVIEATIDQPGQPPVVATFRVTATQ